MKLSDYVIDFLVRAGSSHVFGMSGGAAVHLFDSANRNPGMGTTFVVHEQSAAMAADGYFRIKGKPGVSAVTSGPGATNLLTGTCCSYYDSVPTVMLTGQVATHRLKGDRKVRQVGFQETDVLSIFGSVTKMATQVLDPTAIRSVLEEACYLSQEGRPGPVLVDIPDDLQRADVDPAAMRGYAVPVVAGRSNLHVQVHALFESIRSAKRPVIVVGGGASTPRLASEVRRVLDTLGIPILQTWAGIDVLPGDSPLRIGPFGVYGPRLGNFVVQHCDLLVCLGTRLSQNLTGGLLNTFAPNARIVMVDADQGEMDKFDGRGIRIEQRIRATVGEFVESVLACKKDVPVPDLAAWYRTIAAWKKELPDDVPLPPRDDAGYVDAIHFVRELSAHLSDDEAIFVDTGGNLTWTCNNLVVRPGQRVISAWNFTPMGYALPGAIGGATADPARPITCIIGDGGLALCLGELATVARYNLPIKIILFNNHSHGIQKQTLETWLQANYVGVDPASGLGFPDFEKAAAAAGLPALRISRSADISRGLRELYAIKGPVVCNVEINPDQKLYPVLKYGHPLEDQMPLMDRDRLKRLLEY